MDKLDEKSAEKFINALVKSVQVLCHGYLNFHNGIEIIGHINLSVDKESSLHYILEEKVCKSEENSTMFISNSFYAQKAELQAKEKGCENALSPGSKSVHSLTGTINLNEMSNASLLISTCGSSSNSLDRPHSASTSSASEALSLPCKTASSPAKRKASSDCDGVKSKTKSSYVSPGSERFTSQSPHKPASVSSLEDNKPSVKDLRNEELSEDSMSLPNVRDIVNNLGVDLVDSVLEPVRERTRSDCSDKRDDSDGEVEVTFIKKEFLDDSAYLPDNSCRFQYGRGTPQKASSSGKVADSSVYPDPHAHASVASATYVSSASDLDVAGAQLHGLSTSASQPHQGISFSTEFCQAAHSSAAASATFVPSARGHDVTTAQLYGPSTSSQGVSFSTGNKLDLAHDRFVPNEYRSVIGKSEPCDQHADLNHQPSLANGQSHQSFTSSCQLNSQSVQFSDHRCQDTNHSQSLFIQPQAVDRRLPSQAHHHGLQPSTYQTGLVSTPARPQHNKKWMCTMCSAKYSYQADLKRHVRVRHMDKPRYRCHLCGMGFGLKDHYAGHMGAHNGVKNYQCSWCTRKYFYRSDLMRHTKTCRHKNAGPQKL